MREYKLSNRITLGGIGFLVVASILSGLFIGGTAFALSQVFYLIVLFPAMMGFAGIWAVNWSLKKAHIPNRFVVALFGVVIGIMIYAAYHYTGYLVFRTSQIRAIEKEHSVDNQVASRFFDYVLDQETGSTGFLGYIKWHAKVGDAYSGYFVLNQALVMETPEFALRGGWAWAYWLFEALIIVGATTWASSAVTGQPFCERSLDWYGWIKQIGNVDIESEKAFLDLLQVNDFSRASKMVAEGESTEHPTIEVYAQHCSGNPSSDVLITLKRTCLDSTSKVAREVILCGEIPYQSYLELTGSNTPEDA